MDALKMMNEAVNYIENHLTETVDFDEAARVACCSRYHFQRMFSFLAGVTLSEYIRRRRLTLAAFELENEDTKIINIAMKYGYHSPDSFARAFQSQHGVTPTEARRKGTSLKAFPRMTFQLSVKGGTEMNYRIEEKAAFHVVGKKKKVNLIYQGVNPEIAEFTRSISDRTFNQIGSLSDQDPTGLLSVSANFTEDRSKKGQLDYYLAAATTKQAPENLERLDIPALTWAVFTVEGPFPDALQDVWGRIFSEWFPSSDYELTDGPEILWNEEDAEEGSTVKSEIWIPVAKK
ncbi:AraC family transcriptional regulator [Salicibibacter cibarius]|uniref:AraC family transcriptional regulator n=1 Tax=Salicibibacter cibarius TaxID=2743000 RepID=A0A7T6Z0W1_9BACI|nr:AraC family transcriptional regulator [Salicibibacter cibarius]QQK74923.1 AraC family transcriptional regulator [Salicibibacter cibarius]